MPSSVTTPVKVGLIGGGKGGSGLLDLILDWQAAKVVVVIDPRADAPALAKARALGIPTAAHHLEVFGYPVDLVLEVTGRAAVLNELLRAKPPAVEVIGAGSLRFFWDLLNDRREREARLRAILEAALDCIITIDHEGRVLEFNPAAERTFGYSRTAALGQPLATLIIPPSLRDRHREGLARYLATGAERVLGRRLEMTAVRADGTEVPVELAITRISLEGPPVFTGFIRDISERRLAEAALQETSEALQALVDASPLAIYVVDPQGKVKFWGAAAERMFGWTHREVLAGPVPIVPENKAEEFRALFKRVLEGETLSGVELGQRRKDGSPVDISLATAPLRDADGNITGYVAIVADITERKQLEAQLQQAQKMEAIGHLAGGVAHDFNNLLTVIMARGQMLHDGLSPANPLRRQTAQVLKTADRAVALIRRLLVFSRQSPLQRTVLDLSRVATGMTPMLQPLLGETIELAVVTRAARGCVTGDQAQLEQVITNLAINARDAMPEGGRLIIETDDVEIDAPFAEQHPGARAGPYVMLGVRDTGSGMSAEVQAHLFEPFFTTKAVGRGTGLGLSMVYGIVKQHGGFILVHSEVGRGSAFRIHLPAAEGSVELEGPRETRAPSPRGTETVLLVEDQEGVRTVAREVLEMHGYRVLEAPDGQEALGITAGAAGVIDLLITDVVMPSMNGRELARRFKLSRPQAKVLYMSGYIDDAVAADGTPGAGMPFLTKPFTADGLARKVREVLDARGS